MRVLDDLEEQSSAYVTLDEAQRVTSSDLAREIADAVLLVDYRSRADGTPVTLCRLNRHHPEVQRLNSW